MAQPSVTDVKAILGSGRLGATRQKLEVIDVGRFNVGSGRLAVIDPGFMHPVRLSRLVKSAPPGEARVKLAVVRQGENAGMPAFLALAFSDLGNAAHLEIAQRTKLSQGEEQGYVGVNSGEICIID